MKDLIATRFVLKTLVFFNVGFWVGVFASYACLLTEKPPTSVFLWAAITSLVLAFVADLVGNAEKRHSWPKW